jgi:hypothetical protein
MAHNMKEQRSAGHHPVIPVITVVPQIYAGYHLMIPVVTVVPPQVSATTSATMRRYTIYGYVNMTWCYMAYR